MHQVISIAGKKVGQGCSPLIVAELSGNHQQKYELAEAMVIAAAKAGVDAIKLQTYTAETMTINCHQDDFVINEKNSLWQGENLYELYAKASTPWEWHKPLFDKAKSLGLIAFSSPFDASSVDFLESLDVPCYKIASFENNDLPLIKKVAQTGKPIIMSTGMASEEEINEALNIIEHEGNEQVILLKCTSNYPADASDCHLNTIKDMSSRFKCPVGLSDHAMGINISLAAVALEACLIEKHFILDKKAGGIDAEFSIEINELESLVKESARVYQALGSIKYDGSDGEQASKKYRRSIYVSQDIKEGQTINETNVRIIRPGFGLEPKYYQQIIGKQLNQDVKRGTPLDWSLFVK